MFRAILVTTALIAPSQLFAQATAERAATIAAELDRYLPGDARVVQVVPAGADYTVTIDLEAMAQSQANRGLSVKATPLDLRLTEEAGGTYGVNYDQAVTAKISYRDEINIDFAATRLVGTGQFDPSLGAFTTHEMSYTGFSYYQDYGSNRELGTVTYRLAEMKASSASKANPAGGIDVIADYSGTGLVEDLTMPDPTTGALMPISVKAATYSGTGEFTGTRSLALLDLMAFAVENFPPSPNAPDQQDDLKAKIRAAAPFFETMKVESAMSDLTVDTSNGTFGADTIALNMSGKGATADGEFAQTVIFGGLRFPEGLLPEWMNTLIPADISLGFDLSDFNLAAPLAILLDSVDFKAGPDSAQSTELASALLPSGTADMGFSLGAESAGSYELEASGNFAVGPAAAPSGTARISLSGIDAILAKLNEAPPEIQQSAIPAIGMARGLGKADGDATVWDIEMTQDGKLLVNGNDLSMFMQ